MPKTSKSLRPWGYFKVLLRGKSFWIKRISLNGAISLQSHKKRDEYWLICVPRGTVHKVSGKGDFLELALGDPRESDIKRYDKSR